MHYCFFSAIILFVKVLPASSHTKETSIQYGLLAYKSDTDKGNLCIINYNDFSPLPQHESEVFYFLKEELNADWCDEQPTKDVKEKVVLINSGNCSISTQIANIYDSGGKGILFITESRKELEYYASINVTAAKDINISVALIPDESAERLQSIHSIVSVGFSAHPAQSFDFGILVTFILELLTVIIGSYWSGHVRFSIYLKEINALSGNAMQLLNEPKVTGDLDEKDIDISPYVVQILVCGIAGFILIIYTFKSYFFNLILLAFFLLSTLSVYVCLKPFVLKIKYGKCQFRIGKFKLDVREVSLVLFAFAVSVYWLITRNQAQPWVLQNILGIAVCIFVLKSFRLPSFKICTILLALLLIYDVFVFVTPFLSRKCASVMEDVAIGGANFEKILPQGLLVPYLGFGSLSECYPQIYSFFGFGDIIVPGLLVSYCNGFDLVTNRKKIYFIATIFAYAVGSVMSTMGVLLTNTGQPALLYLVPCTLIPPALIAWRRKEFSSLWTGNRVNKQ